MAKRTGLDPFEFQSTAAPAAGVPPVGDVVPIKPGRQLSMTPNAIRKRAARARDREAVEAAVVAAEAVSRRRRGGRGAGQVAAAGGPADGSEAAVAPPPAAPPAPPVEAAHASDHDPVPHTVELSALTIAAGVSVAACYAVLFSVCTQLYPGLPGALRAALPLCVEMLAGALVHWCVGTRVVSAWLRTPLASAALAVIFLGCVRAELTAAAAVPGAASRARVEKVLSTSGPACKLELSAAPEHEGPAAKLQRERNEGAAREAYTLCLKQSGDRQAQALSNAKETAPGEAELPALLSLLGALGASSFVPLLVALVRVVRRQGKAGAP
jgi:hypothetical protein